MELRIHSPHDQEKTVVKTTGPYVQYSNGETHLDIQCGNMAFILGYQNKDIVHAIAENSVNFVRGNTGETAAANDELRKQICQDQNWAALNWAVSGSDAVEAAIAMNDAYWHNVDARRTKILSFKFSYHGTTMLAKHLRGQYPELNRAITIDMPQWKLAQHQIPQEKLCLAKIKKTLSNNPDVGCFIMETVSWCTGLTPYSELFWQNVRQLCDDYNVLMLLDDVAFCWGTNGTMFGYEIYGVKPDICAIGKSLTAGYSPLGAAVCNQKVLDNIAVQQWDHSHTWQPNMAGVMAGLIATNKIKNLLPRVQFIQDRLASIAIELGVNARGSKTYLSFDFDRNIELAELSLNKMAASLYGGSSVMVFAPLTADDQYFDDLALGLKNIKFKS